MLSPGKWHEQVPKDYLQNLKFRRHLLRAARKSVTAQRVLLEMCKNDILFFINTMVMQFNPATIGHEVGPFISWEFQDRAIVGGDVEVDGQLEHQYGLLECIEDQEDVRWPKSREMGASWLVLIVIVWLCMFHDNKKGLVISRDQDAVDRADDSDSLFWKIDFILANLPDWMKGEVKRRKLGFNFMRTNSTINGEANTIAAGVGGRASILLVDEFGQFRNGFETYSLTSDTSRCRVFVGTHKDASSMMYNLCYDVKFITMRQIVTHWTQHPEKRKGLYKYNADSGKVEVLDKGFSYGEKFKFVMEARPTGGPFPCLRSPWYDKECVRRTDRDVSMNLDIDPLGATDRFFDGYRIQLLKAEFATEPKWRGTLKYNKETGKPIELVEDPQGLVLLWIVPIGPNRLPKMKAGAAVDVSAGSGMTPSCLCVGNVRTGEKVLEYSNATIHAPDFAAFCAAILSLFDDGDGIRPMLIWEKQGSAAFASKIKEVGYSPCYTDNDPLKPGWNVTPSGAKGLMEEYRAALYESRVINRSAFALDECLNFVYTSTGVEYRSRGRKIMDGSGAKIHHGDVVRADALMYKMIKDMGFRGPEPVGDVDADYIHPGTLAGRIALAESEWEQAESEELVWQ